MTDGQAQVQIRVTVQVEGQRVQTAGPYRLVDDLIVMPWRYKPPAR